LIKIEPCTFAGRRGGSSIVVWLVGMGVGMGVGAGVGSGVPSVFGPQFTGGSGKKSGHSRAMPLVTRMLASSGAKA
jgi:hypothetical protein